MTSKPLGELEQAILLAVVRLEDDAYGLTIRNELEKRAGRKVSHGAAYATLERLVRKGHLASRMGNRTAARGGKRKRYFRVTKSGLRALRASREALLSLWGGIEDVLEERR